MEAEGDESGRVLPSAGREAFWDGERDSRSGNPTSPPPSHLWFRHSFRR